MFLIKLCIKNLIKVIELTRFSNIWQNTEQKRCVGGRGRKKQSKNRKRNRSFIMRDGNTN